MLAINDPVGLEDVTDVAILRQVYGQFPTGVTALCALDDGVPVGFAVSSFNTVSADPPLVSVCVQQSSSTWPQLAASPRVGLSILSATQGPLCRQLAAHGASRFAGVSWSSSDEGAVFLEHAVAWLECSVHDVATAGDHYLVLLRVLRHGISDVTDPLVFHGSQFHALAYPKKSTGRRGGR
ncbi:flavin reductase family protein [Rhodococcus pyridinivorans]|uniref:flavin reductase family protein n=1 Tax=Rhodococcus pyridinivorans TaxID=103816 RepID=UPI001E331DEE|nr:flavin reductase family protein [Rhodococcus pyridinivorans]MCD5422439.1 flavin reductase family protein [Rhodococcus pyridinivorans]